MQNFYTNVLLLQFDKSKIELMKIAKNKDKNGIIMILESIMGSCLSVMKFNLGHR